MNSVLTISFQVVEVQSVSNLRFLEKMAGETWYKKADTLDAWACSQCTDEVAKQKIIDSYTTTRQLSRLLNGLIESPETHPGTKVFCSMDAVSRTVEGILVTRAQGKTCEIMFALSNPDNLSIPDYQAKVKSGAISVLLQHMVQNGKEFEDFKAEVIPHSLRFGAGPSAPNLSECGIDSASSLCQRAGFVETGEKTQALYLNAMRLTQAKAQEVFSLMSLNFECVAEPKML